MPDLRKRAGSIAAGACAYLLLALFAGAPVHAADEAGTQAELRKVRSQISDLQKAIRKSTTQRDSLAARLRDAELSVAEARRKLEATRAERIASERRLAELRRDVARSEAVLDSERAELGGQIRAAYTLGREERMKLVLNQQDPARLGRMLAYYGYFGRARATKIDTIRTELARLAELSTAVTEQTQQLVTLEENARADLTAVQDARRERGKVLGELDQKLKTRVASLGKLQREASTLEKLLADLRKVIADFPINSEEPFEKLKGRLPWPLSGKLLADFGQRRAGGVTWNGVLLSAERGARVRAIHFGRVIYADWLPGMGLLTILEHSGGYLTLYGHNDQLYKSVGDWVAPGDVIAAAGDSGGRQQTELYFEIRKGSRPLNPHQWIGKAPRR